MREEARTLCGPKRQPASSLTSDPDRLDQVPSETARRWFQEDVASGRIVVIRK